MSLLLNSSNRKSFEFDRGVSASVLESFDSMNMLSGEITIYIYHNPVICFCYLPSMDGWMVWDYSAPKGFMVTTYSDKDFNDIVDENLSKRWTDKKISDSSSSIKNLSEHFQWISRSKEN